MLENCEKQCYYILSTINTYSLQQTVVKARLVCSHIFPVRSSAAKTQINSHNLFRSRVLLRRSSQAEPVTEPAMCTDREMWEELWRTWVNTEHCRIVSRCLSVRIPDAASMLSCLSSVVCSTNSPHERRHRLKWNLVITTHVAGRGTMIANEPA